MERLRTWRKKPVWHWEDGPQDDVGRLRPRWPVGLVRSGLRENLMRTIPHRRPGRNPRQRVPISWRELLNVRAPRAAGESDICFTTMVTARSRT